MSLAELSGDAPLPPERFLPVALAAARALDAVHRSSLHGDVRPDNLVWRGDAVELVGALHRGPARTDDVPHLSLPAESLPYLAPERTGRTAWMPDRRSDLYSLGVTFYRLLAGALPFEGSDPLEWVHCHLARPPRPLEELAPGVPPALAAVVMKLLAKAPEDRYQTARGLIADLERCRDALAGGAGGEFALGADDVSGELRLPRRLEGRDAELAALEAALDEVATGGAPGLVLVSGPAGIGKSALVDRLHPAVLRAGGMLLSGKPDQYEPGAPYGAIARALGELTERLLTEPESKLAASRERLAEAVGVSGRIVIDLVPRMELVLGEAPPVEPLPGPEARVRFAMVLRRLLGAASELRSPLVLFLDDLQWADPSTIELVTQILTHPDARRLLVIGAYRDDEVGGDHPLSAAREAIAAAGVATTHLELAPLATEHVAHLVAGALRAEPERARRLAEIVREKTGGNPFFVAEFLIALHRGGLLHFDDARGRWEWDSRAIESAQLTGNVVELVIERLGRLPEDTLAALRIGACLGNGFTGGVLALVTGCPVAAAHQSLAAAVDEGLLFRMGESYRFLHDRVQQAAYTLIPERDRPRVHRDIGRTLLAAAQDGDDHLFLIANQLGLGAAAIESPDEAARWAEVERRAGGRARASSAFQAAATYLATGAAMLGERGWSDHYPLMLAMVADRAEAELVAGNAAEAERLCQLLISRARTTLDKQVAYRVKIEMHLGQSDAAGAVGTCLEWLELLGMGIPASPTEEDVDAELAAIEKALADRRIGDLASQPTMADPTMRAAVEALSVASPAAWYMSPHLSHLMLCRLVLLSIEHGRADGSAMGYATLGMVLINKRQQYHRAYEFGRLGLELARRDGAAYWVGMVENIVGAMIGLWARPLRECMALVRQSLGKTTQSGNLTFLSYNCAQLAISSISCGLPLDEAQEECTRMLGIVRGLRNKGPIATVQGPLQYVRALRGLTERVTCFSGADFDEASFEASLSDGDVPLAATYYALCKLQAALFTGDVPGALAAAERASALVGAIGTQFSAAEVRLYTTLAHLAAEAEAKDDEARARHLAEAERLAEPIEHWAEACPENFRHMHALVGAELARARGDDLEAMRLYDQAIAAAREGRYIHAEGLASELCARFHRGRGFTTIASAYVRQARDTYARWGARGLVADLERRYAALLEHAGSVLSGSSAQLGQLDVITVVKLAQAISSEIMPDRLVAALLRIAVEQAGAQVGLFFSVEDGRPVLAARAVAGAYQVAADVHPASGADEPIPWSVIHYVARTRERLILDAPADKPAFSSDPVLARARPRSILCMPLVRQTSLVGLLYLENDLTPDAFTGPRLALLDVLTAQAIISLENARLYGEIVRENAQRIEAQESLRQLNEELAERVAERTAQLRQANEDLEAFSYSVSHDLRAPLRLIERFSAALEDELGPDASASARAHLRQVRKGARRMKGLIDDMLHLWGVTQGEMRREPVDLGEMARGILADLARVEPDRQVDVVVPEQVNGVGEPRLLRIALENLLQNAWKFTSRHGRARIEIGVQPGEDGRSVYFVRDDGVGFDMKYARKLFTPFQRLHGSAEFEGSGIGLATVQKILRLHGGRIWAEGTVGGGATFYFTL